MTSFGTWRSYLRSRLQYSVCVALQKNKNGQIKSPIEWFGALWKNVVEGRMTYLHKNEGKEMTPTISAEGDALLVRKLPLSYAPSIWLVNVGDVVVVRNPLHPHNHIVRRLAALGGQEMLSTDENDEPFVLEEKECWVVSDNPDLKGKEAKDSRLFGPVSASEILGRAVYRLQSAESHGPIENSKTSMEFDSAVIEVELDIDEMLKVSSG